MRATLVPTPSTALRAALPPIMLVGCLLATPTVQPQQAVVREIGSMLFNKTILGGAVGRGPKGEQWAYTVASGEIGVFFVLDAVSGKQIASFPLPDAGGSWGQAVAPNGTVYIGTWPNAHLYRYVPGAANVEDLGQPPGFEGEPFAVWRVDTDEEGNVYGGTSGNTPADGRAFRYDPVTATFTDYGAVSPGNGIVRSVAFSGGHLYLGSGPTRRLSQIDVETGVNTEIPLPDDAPADQYVYDVEVHGELLLARTEPSKTLFVYNLATDRWVDEQANVLGFDFAPPGRLGGTWLVKDEELHHYDLRTFTMTGTGFATSWTRGLDWVRVGERRFPGLSLVSLTGEGDAWIYNPHTGASRQFTPEIDGQPVTLRSVGLGPDGDIYVSSYLSGGLAAYDPGEDAVRQYPPGVGQAGTIATHQDRLFLGIYPSARLLSFDPSQPFDSGVNPIDHFDLAAYRQDRIFAITSIGNRIAIGTVAAAGAPEGTLTIFDPATGSYDVHSGIVSGANVASLAYANGVLYGGAGGQLFAWNVDAAEVMWQVGLGMGTISALTVASEGHVWGVTSSGRLFELDPQTQTVSRAKELYPGETWDENVDALLRHSRVLLDENGYLYGTTLGHLFRINPATLDVETLADGAYLLAQDRAGNFYFARGPSLFVYE
jgi:streptogramin lyase